MSLVTREGLDSLEADSVIHLGEHRDSHRERPALDEPLAFEQMIGELLTEFTNLHAEDVEKALTRAQTRIADAADLDGIAVFEFDDGGDDFALTHAWARNRDALPALIRSARRLFPWLYAHARAGSPASFSSLD